MKKRIFNIVLTVLMLAVLMPVHVLAANTNDEIQVTDEGIVTIVSKHGAEEGISSLQLGLLVKPADQNAKVSFEFFDSVAKIAEFRYHEDSGLLNIYLAGTKALFDESGELSVGTVVVQNQDGKAVTATVDVEKESLKYVYGTELKVEEAEVPEQPVTINAGQTTDPDEPDNPDDPDKPTNPDDPDNPDKPTNPDDPDNPDKPTNPDDGDDDVSKSEIMKELQETLKNAESYSESAYTKESYQAMKKAMEEAKAVLSSPAPTQEELEKALLNLQNAMGALVLSNNDSKTDSDKEEAGNTGSGNGSGTNSNTGADSKTENHKSNGESRENGALAHTGDYAAILPFVGLLLISVIGLWYSRISLGKKE